MLKEHVLDCEDSCNNLSPLLAEIIRFDPLRIVISLTVLKYVY